MEMKDIGMEGHKKDTCSKDSKSNENKKLNFECTEEIFFCLMAPIICLFVPIALVVTLNCYYGAIHSLESFSVDPSTPLKISISNCKLYFEEYAYVKDDTIVIDIDIPGSKYSFSTGSVTELSIENPLSNIEPCYIEINIGPHAQFSDISITCTGICRVVQIGKNPLNLGNGEFSLNGNEVNFMANQIKAGQVTATIKKGNLAIFNLLLGSSTTASCSMSTEEGDIVIQSVESMKISWSQNLNNICFSYKYK